MSEERASAMRAVPSREALDRIAAPGARFVADMNRIGGAYRFDVRPVASDGAGGAPAAPPPGRDDLLAVVPPGSQWVAALGWSAYFGWPLEAAGWHFWALGAEEVRASADGAAAAGGAHPVVRVYLHTAPPVQALDALAASLDPAGAGAGRPDATAAGSTTVFALAGATPEACALEQAAILRQTAAACAAGGTPLFRTAVLSEGEALPMAGFPGRLPRGVDRALLGLPEVLARSFSTRARALLYLRAFWRAR